MNLKTEEKFAPSVGVEEIINLAEMSFGATNDTAKEKAEEVAKLVTDKAEDLAKTAAPEVIEGLTNEAASFIEKALGGGTTQSPQTMGAKLAAIPTVVNAALIDLSQHSFSAAGIQIAAVATEILAYNVAADVLLNHDDKEQRREDDRTQKDKDDRAKEMLDAWHVPTTREAREKRREEASRAMDTDPKQTELRRGGKMFSLADRRGQKRYKTEAA